MTLTPSERTQRARMGAYSLHAQRDPRETTRAARATFLGRFELQVDPELTLEPAERARRAEAARHAYFAGLALKSARARAQRKRPSASARRRPPEAGIAARPTTAE